MKIALTPADVDAIEKTLNQCSTAEAIVKVEGGRIVVLRCVKKRMN